MTTLTTEATYIDRLIEDAKPIGAKAVAVKPAEWGGYYVTILGGRVSEIFETEAAAQACANEFVQQIVPAAAPTTTKDIKYNHGDYDMYLDGEYVGSAACYHVAEVELDRLAYERLDRAGVEPELALTATALDGVCACGATFNEYGQCENCLEAVTTYDENGTPEQIATRDAENEAAMSEWLRESDVTALEPVQPVTCKRDTLGERWTVCGAPGDGACYCEVMVVATTTPDDPGHDLTLPDPAECPDISAPQPVEDLPTCATPDDDEDDEPTDEDGDDWPDGIDDILAPPCPAASSGNPCFILPTGDTAQSIILCIGGVSRVVSAQGVAEALTLASIHPRPQSAPTIVLTSQSPIKLRALQGALDELNITANVVTVKAPSGVNEQPVGDETRRGALNRIAAAREQQAGDLYVSMENGLFHEDGIWTDCAVVVVEYSPDGRPITVVSDGVIFPLDAVEEAQRRGFQTTTVGQVLAEWGIVKDHADPHVDLCGTSRETLLHATARQALASVLT